MTGPFDATGSLLGYLFQCRWALREALVRLRAEGSFTISLETLDDIAFEARGEPIALLQTKHHVKRVGNLTDASEDLWKTIRVWSDGVAKHLWPSDAQLFLITTQSAAAGSIASYLRPLERDPGRARTSLLQVARTSENEANRAAYASFLRLSDAAQAALVANITIFDSSPAIARVSDELERELAFAAVRHLVPALVARLEGWWFNRVVIHLTAPFRPPIRSEEIDAELDRLRPQFADDNLPIDMDLVSSEIDHGAFESHLFVVQLTLIDIITTRVLNAMRQYFRAKEQRSRWLREGFLLVGELARYDARLCEEWDIRYQGMVQDLGEGVAENEMRKAARQLYDWAERESSILIRPACTEPFVPRGSLQMLADTGKVGWHPQFLDRLRHLLETAS